ncbi:MAG: putative glutamate--cysteine ligase 2 [Acidimicrobiales bacterium]|nr:putative glutamate--cysteine ligase 2 [Acidimicrobiales bacterium]
MRIDFASNEQATLGIEVELTMVDTETGAAVCCSSGLLQEMGIGHPEGTHPKAKHELFETTVEIITDVCKTVREAKDDLQATLDELRSTAGARGVAPISVGTHPFATYRGLEVSPSTRYLELVEEMQWAARRLFIMGIHYHVGVSSPERAITILNAMCGYLPYFVALSASSPFYEQEDTGLASSRIKVFESLPTAGLPPRLGDWAEFEELMGTLLNAGAIRSIREIWWDIRPHPNFGTIELRMCDAMPTLKEIAAVAALAQSLVVALERSLDRGEDIDPLPVWTICENRWLAARHGLDAELIVDNRGTKRAARELIVDLIRLLHPTAAELGCGRELDDVLTILDAGPSYARQRRILASGGNPLDIVHSLVRELESDEPERP